MQVGTPLLPRYTLSKTRFRLEFVSWEWGVLWSEETLNNLHNNNAQVAFILTGHVTDSVSECTWISQIKESRKNRKEQSCHLSRLYVKYRLKVMLVRIPRLSRETSKTLQRNLAKLDANPSSDNWNACSWDFVIHVYRRVYPQMPLEDISTNLKHVEKPSFVFFNTNFSCLYKWLLLSLLHLGIL